MLITLVWSSGDKYTFTAFTMACLYFWDCRLISDYLNTGRRDALTPAWGRRQAKHFLIKKCNLLTNQNPKKDKIHHIPKIKINSKQTLIFHPEYFSVIRETFLIGFEGSL
jgi:hypothetical protein